MGRDNCSIGFGPESLKSFGLTRFFCHYFFMAIDDLKKLTTGFIKGWKKGKLKETLKETANLAIDEKVKNARLKKDLADAQDEIRRLKDEKAKPKFKKKIKKVDTKDLNPKEKRPHEKRSKKETIEIDKEVDLHPEDLPNDAKYIGKRDVVVQEVELKRNNIRFIIHRYRLPDGRILEGERPDAFKTSAFGPKLRAHIIYLYYKLRVPHKKIRQYFEDLGIVISDGFISSILNKLDDEFRTDLESARKAALKKQSWLHLDETGAKLNGIAAYTFGVSNNYFTTFHTGLGKGRNDALKALLMGRESYLFDDKAIEFIAKKCKIPDVTIRCRFLREKILSLEDIEQEFEKLPKIKKRVIKTAGLQGALRSGIHGPPIKFLISDDGTNFTDILEKHQLCWVHEIRKYKLCELFKELEVRTLSKLENIWRLFYGRLKRFKNNPNKRERELIRKRFDQICLLRTGVKALDEQLGRTKKLKEKLLLVLKYPQLPIHNNLSENDLRERVIKRKISLQNRSLKGMKAWDLMLSLASTCRKLGLSFWKYLEDRISKREEIHYLGRLINQL